MRTFHPHAQPDAMEIPARHPSCILAHERRYPPYAETTAHRLVNLNMVLSTYYRLWRMIRPSTWPWRSIAHHLGLQHHITISGNRGQRSREDLLWGAVGSIPGNRRNRRAIRVKHIGTLPLNPYCGLQLLVVTLASGRIPPEVCLWEHADFLRTRNT
jgi:hypothetical protein